jgi:hypothetical protein
MPRYEAPEILRSKVYLDVHRNDEGSGERSRWAFFGILLLGSISPSFSMMDVGMKDFYLTSYHISTGVYKKIKVLKSIFQKGIPIIFKHCINLAV